jgi:hypothetical protein
MCGYDSARFVPKNQLTFRGVRVMDDTACRTFFAQPTNPYHRRYEALRAVFVDGRAPKDVAEQFGLACNSLRQLLYEFRQHCQHSADGSPFFESRKWDGLPEHPQRPRLPGKSFPLSPIAGSSCCRHPNPCA